MTKKAFVLLSGGLDSTTCLYKAIFDYLPENPDINLLYGDTELIKEALKPGSGATLDIPWVEAISINYGQRHKKEMEYAAATCSRLGIQHTILDVGALLSGAGVMLTDPNVVVPSIDYADIKGVSPTYVPFRNGLLLSAITAHAQKWVNAELKLLAEQDSMGCEEFSLERNAERYEANLPNSGIYFGAHSEDAQNWAYPDCTPEFIGAMANAIFIGSYKRIRLHTPIQWLMKHEIVTMGHNLGVPFETTWSCYKGEDLQCGECPTCRSRKQAFKLAGIPDPTKYAK